MFEPKLPLSTLSHVYISDLTSSIVSSDVSSGSLPNNFLTESTLSPSDSETLILSKLDLVILLAGFFEDDDLSSVLVVESELSASSSEPPAALNPPMTKITTTTQNQIFL